MPASQVGSTEIKSRASFSTPLPLPTATISAEEPHSRAIASFLQLAARARVVDISCGSLDSNPMPGERMLFPKLSAGDAVLPTERTGLHRNR